MKGILKILVHLGVGLGITVLLAWIFWDHHCFNCCSRGVETADRLAAQGNLRGALLAIDSADDQCQCSRFTQGDAPPEYSAAQTYLRMLGEREGRAAVIELSKSARGPIMRQLVGAALRAETTP